MGALTGSTISSSYDMLLKTATTGGITGTLKVIEDGLGIDSALKLSTTVVGVNGSLGVGLDSPEYVIHAQTADDYVGKFESTDAGASIILEDNGSTTDGNRITVTSDVLSVATANVTALTVDSSQNVGIGGTPASPLDVYGDDAADNINSVINCSDSRAMAAGVGGGISFFGKYTTGGSYSIFGHIKAGKESGTTGEYAGYLSFSTRSSSSLPAEAMRIDSAGNVGIGTDAPSTGTHSSYRNLVIGETTDATSGLSFKASTAGSSAIFFSNGATPFNRGQIIYDHDDDSMAFSSSGTEAMRIDSSGNVGIGEASTSQKLEVTDSQNGGSIPIVVANRDITAGTDQKVSIGFGLSRNSGAFKDRAGKIQVGRESDWTAEDGNIDSFMSFHVYQDNTESEAMRITSDGHVILANVQEGSSGLASGTIYKDSGFLKIVA